MWSLPQGVFSLLTGDVSVGAGRHIWVMSAVVYMCINVCVGLDLHVRVMCVCICMMIRVWLLPSHLPRLALRVCSFPDLRAG